MTTAQRWVLAVISAGAAIACFAGAAATCAGCIPAASPEAKTCAAQYASCGTFSANMQAYLSCRADVDKQCMPSKGADHGDAAAE